MVNKRSLQRLSEGALDLLAPQACCLCGMPSGRSIALCRPCESSLPRNQAACRLCALPLAGADLVCGLCQRRPPPARISVAPILYTEPVAGLIRNLKYRGDFSQVAVLSQLMLNTVRRRLVDSRPPDFLLPMPLHWWRQWRRGFNQAELLARSLCNQAQLQPWALTIDKRLCRRQRHTLPQASLSARERAQNLRGALVCRRQLNGEHIAIVDDVVTTGTSAWSLASVLLAAGAGEVEIWCCARTPGQSESARGE